MSNKLILCGGAARLTLAFRKIVGMAVIGMLLLSVSAVATIELHEFKDDVTRQRYQSFIEEMRCPKCQNQNLAGSDSPIASDLRRELRRLLEEGRSDKEIVDFMVDRYGDYILYRPKVQGNTLVLWGLPLLLLLSGALVAGFTVRRRSSHLGGSIDESGELAVESGGQEEPVDREKRLAELLKAAAERDFHNR